MAKSPTPTKTSGPKTSTSLWSEYDGITREFEVVVPQADWKVLPVTAGTKFKGCPEGDFYWKMENCRKMMGTSDEINRALENGHIKLIGPKRLLEEKEKWKPKSAEEKKT